MKDELEKNNLDSLGEILDESWKLKKSLATGISNEMIDFYYEKAKKAGAKGGKLLGAGGGGFLLFYVNEEHRENVENALSDLRKFDFNFDWQGSTVIYVGDHYIK